MLSENQFRLLERLEELAQQFMRRMHTKMEMSMIYGITGSQFFVLKRIRERKRLTVSEAAENLGVSLSAITALVDRLVKTGMVTRTRDENDRRLVWLEITPEGEEVLQSCVAGRKRIMEKYLGQLPEEDLVQLVNIYEKLFALIRQEEKNR